MRAKFANYTAMQGRNENKQANGDDDNSDDDVDVYERK
jgi:hypothetical protein